MLVIKDCVKSEDYIILTKENVKSHSILLNSHCKLMIRIILKL